MNQIRQFVCRLVDENDRPRERECVCQSPRVVLAQEQAARDGGPTETSGAFEGAGVGKTMEHPFVNRQAKGFTLIELMVTLAVLAILATVGIPSFQRLAAENRVSAQANATQAALQFARSEALKRRCEVVVRQDEDLALIVRPVAGCDGDDMDLLVLPINPRVEVTVLPGPEIRYVANGYIRPFAPINIDIADRGGAVDTRRVRVEGSGFSEVTRITGS